ncbi:MAG: cell envelope integrity protein TolA [Proteobacteria bacterium]|nr:cell envelope integrity protein TolA [Pseudomonadota bacterium]
MSTYNPPADKLRPPPERGIGRALLFAALMHVMLILVIALGVHWKSHPPEAVEAELWAPTAHLAAPRPPKKVTPQPVLPEVKPQPAPPPPAPPVTRTPPAPDNAEIALEKARRLKQQEEQRQAALLAQQQAEKRLAAKLAAEKLAREQQREQAREQQREQAREEKQRLAQEKIAEQRKQAELQKKQELKAEKQRKAEQQLAKLQQQARSDYMKNLMSQAGTGPSTSTGTAAVSSGPSGKYAARLATLVRQNVIFAQIDQIQGDPKVIITVTLDPNSGEVLGTSIKRSSGVPSWDQAVLRAIQRVGRFPADSNGRWYTPMEIKAGPRDEG